MRQNIQSNRREAGFSLMELMVAMCVMMVITGAATSLLVGAFNVRAREDSRSEAIGDARRALNILSRELANSGYQLPTGLSYNSAAGTAAVPVNGLLPADCDSESITFVANLNANGAGGDSDADEAVAGGDSDVNDANEALTYQFVLDGDNGFLVRRDLNPGGVSQTLANGVDGVEFVYLNAAGADTSANVAQAVRVRITVWTEIGAVGRRGTASYQPPSQVRLTSDVDLRNATLGTF